MGHLHCGPRCLLSALGRRECQDQAVSTLGELWLQPEQPPQEWVKIEWRVNQETTPLRILTVEKNTTIYPSKSPLFGRAVFQPQTLSLRISPVLQNDSGVYTAEFADASGNGTTLCFNVSVPGDADPIVCSCNASNPVSWSTASADTSGACNVTDAGFLWWAVAVSLGLALTVSIALVVICCWRRKRGKDPPAGPIEEALTIYEEVGKAPTIRNPGFLPQNRSGKSAVEGNTIYAVVCATEQEPRHPKEPESCTIYSVIQPRKVSGFWAPHPTLTGSSCSASQSPSLRRKRLDPALMSTAYAEVTAR
ncbi:PREDICTED: natural killer cell receptor 2B4, partial [Mesitornis unicolor]|uniref:natural killer cell receptor 2B4 n=1 Tax=Mesitornis unicolor TaxID=54374 RepID=UPI0005287279